MLPIQVTSWTNQCTSLIPTPITGITGMCGTDSIRVINPSNQIIILMAECISCSRPGTSEHIASASSAACGRVFHEPRSSARPIGTLASNLARSASVYPSTRRTQPHTKPSKSLPDNNPSTRLSRRWYFRHQLPNHLNHQVVDQFPTALTDATKSLPRKGDQFEASFVKGYVCPGGA